MKITYLADSPLPSDKANTVHVMSMCKAFAENGHEVTLLTRLGKEGIDPFEYYNVPKGLFKIYRIKRPKVRIIGGFIYGRLLKKQFEKLPKPDLIYSRSIHALVNVNPQEIGFFYESHWAPQNYLYFFWQKSILKKKNLVKLSVISSGLKNIYQDLYPKVSPDKFAILHDGCDDPLVTSAPVHKERLQVGYVGSFRKGNGYDIIPDLAKVLSNVDFHIIGGNELIVSELKSSYPLKNLFIHGHVPHKELRGHYDNMDVMLAPYQKDLPSLNWASPLKIYEYMAYKKPIIISDFPIFRETLDDNCAMIVESDDLNKWIEAIMQLQSPTLRQELAEKAYERFKVHYTWKSRAKEIVEYFINK